MIQVHKLDVTWTKSTYLNDDKYRAEYQKYSDILMTDPVLEKVRVILAERVTTKNLTIIDPGQLNTIGGNLLHKYRKGIQASPED